MLLIISGITPAFLTMLPNQVSVVEAATNVKINKTKVTLIKGQTVRLKITGTEGKVVWSSSDKKIAVVNSNGKVTAKAKGTATITAKIQNKKYTCKVTVKQKNVSTSKVPVCTERQTVYARGSGKVFNNLVLPECFIYIKNLDKNAKVVNIKSTNPKIKATKQSELDAIEVSNVNQSSNLAGTSSKITFEVIQNKKIYSLSCTISVVKSPSPFEKFKVGSKNIAKSFYGTDNDSESFSGKKKVTIKMTKDYMLDSIEAYYLVNGKINCVTIKNGANVNFDNCQWISVNYYKIKKPANYVTGSKWYGVVKSPLHDCCNLYLF